MLICTQSKNYSKKESEIYGLLSQAKSDTLIGQVIQRGIRTKEVFNTLIATLKDYAVDDAGALIKELGKETVNKLKQYNG